MNSAQGLKNNINLIPSSDFERSFWGKFLSWTVTTGRYIIILVELVVILAFLYRFKLDSDLSELNQSIKSKASYIESQNLFRSRFDEIKGRIDRVGGILESNEDFLLVAGKIAASMPEGGKLSNLQFETDRSGVRVNFVVNTVSETQIADISSRLTSDGLWKKVELLDMSTEPGRGVKAGYRLTY